jgi:hypothetical protein
MAPVFEITANRVSQASGVMAVEASSVLDFSRSARAASSPGLRLPVANTRSKVIDAAEAMGMPPTDSESLAMPPAKPKLSAVTMIGSIVETETLVSLMRVTHTTVLSSFTIPCMPSLNVSG